MRTGSFLFFFIAMMMMMMTVEIARAKPKTYLVETADDDVHATVDPSAEPHRRAGQEEELRGNYNKV